MPTNLPPDIRRRAKFSIFGGLLLVLCLTVLAMVIYAVGIKLAPPEVPPQPPDPFAGITLEAHGAYVLDIRTQRMLFAKNADTPLPLASITKVPLTVVLHEVLSDDEKVVISAAAAARSMDLTEGEVWRARDLQNFMLLASSNAAAIALAETADERLHARYPDTTPHHAAVDRMNALMRTLGLSHTHFRNPSGLDESKTRASATGTAREVAELFAYAALNAPELFVITREREVHFAPTVGAARQVRNTNEVAEDIRGLILGKTGTTPLAGGNLGIVFEPRPGHPVAIVLLRGTESGRFVDMMNLVAATEEAFNASK